MGVYNRGKIRSLLLYKGIDKQSIVEYFRFQYEFSFHKNTIENSEDFANLEEVTTYLNDVTNKVKQKFIIEASKELILFYKYKISSYTKKNNILLNNQCSENTKLSAKKFLFLFEEYQEAITYYNNCLNSKEDS
jgi:hypothetical protein